MPDLNPTIHFIEKTKLELQQMVSEMTVSNYSQIQQRLINYQAYMESSIKFYQDTTTDLTAAEQQSLSVAPSEMPPDTSAIATSSSNNPELQASFGYRQFADKLIGEYGSYDLVYYLTLLEHHTDYKIKRDAHNRRRIFTETDLNLFRMILSHLPEQPTGPDFIATAKRCLRQNKKTTTSEITAAPLKNEPIIDSKPDELQVQRFLSGAKIGTHYIPEGLFRKTDLQSGDWVHLDENAWSNDQLVYQFIRHGGDPNAEPVTIFRQGIVEYDDHTKTFFVRHDYQQNMIVPLQPQQRYNLTFDEINSLHINLGDVVDVAYYGTVYTTDTTARIAWRYPTDSIHHTFTKLVKPASKTTVKVAKTPETSSNKLDIFDLDLVDKTILLFGLDIRHTLSKLVTKAGGKLIVIENMHGNKLDKALQNKMRKVDAIVVETSATSHHASKFAVANAKTLAKPIATYAGLSSLNFLNAVKEALNPNGNVRQPTIRTFAHES